MKINKEKTMYKLGQIFGWKALDIAENIIDRVDDFEDENSGLFDELCQCADTELIYTEDQWTIIAEYITPSEISENNFYDIFNRFVEDIFSACVVDYA